MADQFVWFDLRTSAPEESRSFYEQLFGWEIAEVPAGDTSIPMIGGDQPWASVVGDGSGYVGWCPYVDVEDLQAATDKARRLGATVLQPATEGPAGTYTPIKEPGGAVFALFQARS